MNTQDYYEYLASNKWLIKKAELINIYIKKNWQIDCYCCGSTDNLQVHHFSYKHIGNEVLDDERIWELTFMCRDCHKKWHFQKDFKKQIEDLQLIEFNKGIELWNKSYGKKTIH